MKYYYTNKNGKRVYVDKDHLDTALSIKRQLQMESPSHRVNWRKHKKMMEQEGFYDSEASESYRMLIRNYETRIVQDSYESHEDEKIKTTSKLESIKEAVGDLYYYKREVQLENQKLNKFKRDLTLYGVIAEEIRDAIENIEIKTPKYRDLDLSAKDREMVVLPSDSHIGYMDRDFNFNVAMERMDRYIDSIIEYAKIFDINKFHVVHCGDIIENLYMHKNTQAYNAEFTVAEQIVKATEMMYYFIESLSLEGQVIFRGIVRGNHGRASDKKETIANDCAEFIVHEMVKALLQKAKLRNVIIDESGYNIERSIFDVKGKTFKVIHGDRESQNDKTIIQKHISLENRLIDVLCRGHFHNFGVSTENFGRLIYQSGCLQGSNDYSKSLKFDSIPSQGFIIVSKDEVIPINVNLL